jgi:hypothetical protein
MGHSVGVPRRRRPVAAATTTTCCGGDDRRPPQQPTAAATNDGCGGGSVGRWLWLPAAAAATATITCCCGREGKSAAGALDRSGRRVQGREGGEIIVRRGKRGGSGGGGPGRARGEGHVRNPPPLAFPLPRPSLCSPTPASLPPPSSLLARRARQRRARDRAGEVSGAAERGGFSGGRQLGARHLGLPERRASRTDHRRHCCRRTLRGITA